MPKSADNPLGQVSFPTTEDLRGLFDVIFATLREPMLVLGSDRTVQLANPAFCNVFGIDLQHTIGHNLHEIGNAQWDIAELRRMLDEVVTSETSVAGCCVDCNFERIGLRVLMVKAQRAHREGSEPLIVLTFYDNTEIQLAKEYSDKLVDALRDPFLVLDWDLRVRSANGAFYNTFEVRPGETEGRLVYELGNGQWNIPRLRELLEDILPRDSSFDDFEVEHRFADIGSRVMLLNARRIDHLKLILLVIEDVTDARRARKEEVAVLAESQHRVKNLLMTVQALYQLTSQSSSSLEGFAESFDARLDAMARTQDLLVRELGTSARLDEIIRLELHAMGAREHSTFSLQGPELRLSDRASHAFAMTVHELTTNAAKYGALSRSAEDGRVVVTWSAHALGSGICSLRFRWREHGLVARPARGKNGFGTEMIESSLPYLFTGSSTLHFHDDGVECLIDIDLPSAELSIVRGNKA
ncbi:MAG TPA: HWE histidine kinase domain-containing protein [Bryobacteraceae bacterium]|nr:HWE histidine kinase domain-containing protein [Bryobacteraceae bacterium]